MTKRSSNLTNITSTYIMHIKQRHPKDSVLYEKYDIDYVSNYTVIQNELRMSQWRSICETALKQSQIRDIFSIEGLKIDRRCACVCVLVCACVCICVLSHVIRHAVKQGGQPKESKSIKALSFEELLRGRQHDSWSMLKGAIQSWPWRWQFH